MATMASDTGEGFRIGRVLGQAVEVIATNPVVFLGLALIINGIPQAIISFFTYASRAALAAGGPTASLAYFGNFWWLSLIGFMLSALLTCALTRAAIEFLGGARPTIGDCLATAAQVLLPAMGIALLVAIGSAIGMMLLIVPGVILWLGWSLAIPALVQERRGVLDSMSRSRQLARGRKWRLLGLFLCVFIVAGLGQAIVNLMLSPLPPIVVAIGTGIVGSLIACFLATAQAASYVELRRIVEGTDVNELASIFA